MKILTYTDNHWSQYSSILRKRGDRYTVRLENQIQSVNWAEALSKKLACDMVIHCGDFFDKESLNSMEITALKELQFNQDIPHYILVGNHEMGINSLEYSSTHVFEFLKEFTVITDPCTLPINDFTEIAFLPYILEQNRKSLSEYFPGKNRKRLIFSHNDIAGINLGGFITKTGFSIEEIESNCTLFVNGHLHNGLKVSDKIFNIGNLTGQNFSEDAFNYKHCVFVIDTETCRIDVYENPYAINFYKIDFTENDSKEYIDHIADELNNAVVTIKCRQRDYEYVNEKFNPIISPTTPHTGSILESRIIVQYEDISLNDASTADSGAFSVDHIAEFRNYILSELGTNELVLSEIEEITK